MMFGLKSISNSTSQIIKTTFQESLNGFLSGFSDLRFSGLLLIKLVFQQ